MGWLGLSNCAGDPTGLAQPTLSPAHLIMVEPLAIAPQLLAQLQQAITSRLASGDRSGASVPPPVPPSIPLYRAKDTQRIVYISPVALQLAKQGSMPPMEIAQAIAEGFPDSRPPNLAFPIRSHHWSLSVIPPGKLYLELTDPGIAIWLQQAIAWDLQPDATPDPGPLRPAESLDLFPIQYAHARCCALLRLAQREGLITLETPAHPGIASVTAPNLIPWLESPTHLKTHHPAERALISRAIATLDAFSSPVSSSQITSRFAVATLLSQDFLTFYAQCQILGSVPSQDPDLAQARLGLISLTQKLLKRLLEKELSSFAPLEL
ncbi:DALR anticodon-binding domain-containing protein [Laspinema sp. D6]|nr:DALR anticodon-binding domain-containing protein [Laspinema sp. D3a]